MSRDRFLQIMRYLHFTDNQEEVSDKNSPDYDKLFKKRKVLDLLVPRLLEVKTQLTTRREIWQLMKPW